MRLRNVLFAAVLCLSGAAASVCQTVPILADYAGALREAKPRADNIRHVDTPALMERLKQLHVNTYVFLVWNETSDWDDLRNEFLPAAQKAGLDVWVYLVPPSECTPHCSMPYEKDYVRWSVEIAKLSLQFPNLKAWAVDDFNYNLKVFTPAYMAEMRKAGRDINPRLRFFPQLYYRSITEEFLAANGESIDGIIFAYRDDPFRNTLITATLDEQLEKTSELMRKHRKDLILMIYGARLSRAEVAPTAAYLQETVSKGFEYARAGRVAGLCTYVLPKSRTALGPSANRAHGGLGRGLLSTAGGTPPEPGAYGELATTAKLGAGEKSISFWYKATAAVAITQREARYLQVLAGGKVAGEWDVADIANGQWKRETVRFAGLAGETATLAFRITDKKTVKPFILDIVLDDIEAAGMTLPDGGFEKPGEWNMRRTAPAFLPAIDVFDPRHPILAFDAISGVFAKGAQGWQSLFDGKTLNGWRVMAKPEDRDKQFWSVKDGLLTCDSRGRKQHNYVWLVREGEYGDFELELEVRGFRESGGNSGVQVRSRYDEAAQWMNGPQVDIHPPAPWRTGLIYDETRETRRWVFPSLKDSRIEASQGPAAWAWKYSDDGDGWNIIRIVCSGKRISTWVNGLPIAWLDGEGLLDDAAHRARNAGLTGQIALQLHNGDDLFIQYRNLRLRTLSH